MSKSKMVRDLTMLGLGACAIGEASIMFGMPWGSYIAAKSLALKLGANTALQGKIAGGLLTAGGLGGAAYMKHKKNPKTVQRRSLMEVFDEGGIFLIKGNNIIYPTIRGIGYSTEKLEFVFTLPFGLNYKKVEDNLWLFKQKWTEYVELKHEGNNVRVSIYFEPIKTFDYDYNSIEPLLKNHTFPVYMGKDREGHICYDATGDANLLVAGINGSGKSRFLHSVIATWIQYFSPDELVLHLADLKHAEFGIYRKVKHVKSVSNTIKEVEKVVDEISEELHRRCRLLDELGENHIKDVKGMKLPIIVFAVDEVAVLDLKNKDNSELAYKINLICALGRACNIQCVLAMQRPDSEQLDSKAKANLNVRAVFRQNSTINSNVALDSDEAAHIPNTAKGLMAFSYDGIKYVQAPLITTQKTREIIDNIVEKYGENNLQKVFYVENGQVVDKPQEQPIKGKGKKKKHKEKVVSLEDYAVFGE